ncbi:hypothetical protein [Streptomyces blattellae]|uniref:hypothetical protein n=1 Tax=Streptomyces blattellae TaxID=2569855 RepID=UPI0012B9692C|nr:hypothetical protein [Streptomyces blattellae]
MTAEHNGADALMAALTGEPLTDEARADAAFLTEHESALADLALLREQLGFIGDTLAAEPAKQRTGKPAPVRHRGRGTLRVALGGLAVACAAALFAGMGWLVVQSGGSASDSGAGSDSAASEDAGKASGKAESASQSGAGYLACARLVVEGTVTAVEPVPGTAQDRVTLDVTRYYKPARGEDEIVFVMSEDVDPRLSKGDHTLIGIPRDAASPDIWTVGEKAVARERAWITRALPESRTLTCE